MYDRENPEFSAVEYETEKFPNLMMEWEWIGEGICCEYNPDDPEDEPLLRFTVYVKDEDGGWEQAEDCSYCTNNAIDTPMDDLLEMADCILSEYTHSSSRKRAMEEVSWITPWVRK